MGNLSSGLHSRGVQSVAYNTFHSYLGYKEYVHNTDIFELEWMLRDMVRYFDLFHFHYSFTLLPEHEDLPMLAAMGKPMVMHHWGNDVRTYKVAVKNNLYAYTGDSPSARKVHQSLQTLSRYIGHAIVQDYEVYPYVSSYYRKVHVLPITMNVSSRKPQYPDIHETRPLIIHAPTNPLFKGTKHIEQAIQQLQENGIPLRYRRIEKMSNEEAFELYKHADIVVDQVLCGSYGMLAVESMCLGKPVVGYLREDLRAMYEVPPPIVSANPSNLYEVLKELILSGSYRLSVGKKGRKFVEEVHDIDVVSQQLLQIYHEIQREV